ncbi:MAG: peptidase and in, kexin, sedolisin [Bryobacterales bacterium]|nr:peptidase and in, kexin, sedolisin [Bryobacterales bacterium]
MRLSLALLFAAISWAQVVPNQYIVQLSTDPVATHVAGTSGRFSPQTASAASHRALVRTEQAQVRSRLEQQGATVLETADTVMNALFVEITAANPQPWSGIANVTRVYPVQFAEPFLDRAVVVNRVVDAWAQIGQTNAGAGIKIAVIDSGIDVNHAAFQNSPLVTPASFPRVNANSDTAFTNNKVIVARSYVSLLPTRDPDTSARDHSGHGTALGMVSAGGTNAGPLATITGVAPAAWLGSYKIFGSPGVNDNTTTSAIIKAIDDAVADGMDVINLSLGVPVGLRLQNDPTVAAVEAAANAGVIVVVAVGNTGSDPNTIASPATAPDVISVSAQQNDRAFTTTVQASGFSPFLAIAGNGPAPASPITGNLVDAASLDGTGLACNAIPANSLSGRVALILRGTCTFQLKLTNAQQAGAIGAVIYAAASSPTPIAMDTAGAALPAEMISNADGVTLKQAIASGQSESVTLSYAPLAVSVNANQLTVFGSAGPNVDGAIKPDLIAVGQDMYMATQSFDPNGEMYSANGYISADGTSFSAPMTAGSAALVKSALPGLTAAQYRSLIVNSASSTTAYATVQQSGAGSLNTGAALLATATASPVSLSFGAGGSFPQLGTTLTITNVGAAADTFTLTQRPSGAGPVPVLSATSVPLAPGASATISLGLQGSNLAPGSYEGFIAIAGTSATVETRVPYWYAVSSDTPARITVLDSTPTGNRASRQPQAIAFRITDPVGIPFTNVTPEVTATAGGGSVTRVYSDDVESPGLFLVDVRLGAAAGTNTFHIQAASLSADVIIVGQ